MKGVSKAAIVALCFNLAAYGSAFAGGTPTSAAPSDGDRLEQLLERIDQQSAKLAQQQADIDHTRAELEKQKAELLKLRASFSKSASAGETAKGSSGTIASANGNDAHASIVRTRYGYIPVPRTAPRANEDQSVAALAPASQQARGAKTAAQAPNEIADASASSPGHKVLVGSTAKNDFGIPAPQSPQMVAQNNNPYDAEGRIHLHTLKDLVHAAIAPTLAGQSEVGEKPKKDTPGIDIAVLADRGGVLTPKGTLVITPTIEYTHSSVQRFFFDGVELVEAVNIGNLLAESIDRDSITSTFAFRYGLTRRLEVDAQVPFLYRDDRTVSKDFQISGFPNSEQALRGEFHRRHRIRRALSAQSAEGALSIFRRWNSRQVADRKRAVRCPLRPAKRPSAPFADRLGFLDGRTAIHDDLSVRSGRAVRQCRLPIHVLGQCEQNHSRHAQELPMPAQARHRHRKKTGRPLRMLSRAARSTSASEWELASTNSVSMSIGYQHSWVMGTNTHTRTDVLVHNLGTSEVVLAGSSTGVSHSQDAQLGQLLIGASVAVDKHVGLNFNVGIGVTDNAPDVTVTFRTPLTWRLFH